MSSYSAQLRRKTESSDRPEGSGGSSRTPCWAAGHRNLPINPGDGVSGPAAWEPDGGVTELQACQLLHFLLFQLKECDWASAASQKIKPPNSEKPKQPENRFLSDYKERFYLEHRKVHFMVLGAHTFSSSKTKTPCCISILLIPNY